MRSALKNRKLAVEKPTRYEAPRRRMISWDKAVAAADERMIMNSMRVPMSLRPEVDEGRS